MNLSSDFGRPVLFAKARCAAVKFEPETSAKKWSPQIPLKNS